jgi:hypothetical protein
MNWPQRIIVGLVALQAAGWTQRELQGAWRWIAGGLVILAFLALDAAAASRRQRAGRGPDAGA